MLYIYSKISIYYNIFKEKDSCGGDSGGPLMIAKANSEKKRKYWTQIGVVSWGRNTCGTNGVPGVYANVNYHLQWILDHLS